MGVYPDVQVSTLNFRIQVWDNSIPRYSTPPAVSGPQKMWTSPTKPWFLGECLRLGDGIISKY